MIRALAFVLLASAVLVVSAVAAAATNDTPPGVPTVTVPGVSTPIVTTPAITTPVVKVPSVPVTPPRTPVVPPARTLPKPPSVETRQNTVTTMPEVPAPTFGAATGSSSSSGSSSPAAAVGTAPAAHRAGSRAQTTLAVSRFHLALPATVHMTVWQEAPRCRFFGRYTFTAARGTNALQLPHRIADHPLVVGRYRLVGLAHARNVVDERVRVERANGRLRVRKIYAAGGCSPGSEEAILSSPSLLTRPSQRVRGGSAPPSPIHGASRSASAPTAHPAQPSPKVFPQLSASVRHTLIFVLLAIAIALLTVSSLPESTLRSGPAAAALAHHRGALTSAGLAMIVAAGLALLLT